MVVPLFVANFDLLHVGKNDVANLSHSVYYYSIYVFSINLDGYTYTLVVVYNISKEIEWQFHFYYIWKC
jgi:hypothetical protein